MSFIKDREPVAVAAFVLAAMQGGYQVAVEFGHKLTTGQWGAITALVTVVIGFFVRGAVTSNATLAAVKPSAAPTTPPAAPVA